MISATDGSYDDIVARLAASGRRFDAFGWTLGTSGNFSAVVSRRPLRLAITPSGAAKGSLQPDQMLLIDADCRRLDAGVARPSAEAMLHLEIVCTRDAGAVFHTHSVWSTVLSDQHAASGGLSIEGYEMLKGLAGVQTHEHREWVPILENAQDIAALAARVRQTLTDHPTAHGFLLRRHGLYTWGSDIAEATRHIEILEFLLEAVGRGGRAG